MTDAVIAISTYGTQRVKDPATQQTVSAHKIGYSSAAAHLLLALYGEQARDVSPRQASYFYIRIDSEVVVRHGYILLTLTPKEIARAEETARRFHRAAAYLWQDGVWRELPNNRIAEYAAVLPRSGPNFDPTGFRPPSPSTGERESVVSGITAEKSQRSPSEKPWWWINGDTYSHRELLKRHGARFSGKRKAWYWVGAELPAAIRTLVMSESRSESEASDDEPCTVDEATAILGMQIKSAPVAEPPPRLFALHDIAYARHELETADGKPIPTGTRGKVVKLYHHNAKYGWSYDVDFEQIGICWSFERELTPHEPIPGIKIVRGAVVPPGAVLPPTDAEIKRTMIEYGQQPPAEEISTDVEPTHESISTPEEVQPPAIRILKPVPIPAEGEPLDAVQTAIRAIKTQPFASVQREASPNGRAVRIEQAFVGELTGSITGNVWCYGYAVHEGVCVYLNMGGPRMAVEAIRAKLSKGDQVSVVPPDAPAIELTAGEGNSGMYHPYLHYLPEARFTSLILVHDWAVTPNYGGKATTFIFRTSEAQAIAKLKHHVMQLVNVPVFDAWAAYLYEAGQRAMLVRKTRSAGGIDLVSVDLDVDAWTRLITGGLEQKQIKIES